MRGDYKHSKPYNIAPNILCQPKDCSLGEFLRYASTNKPEPKQKDNIKICHIINFFSINGKLDDIQSLTSHTMQEAKKIAGGDIRHIAVLAKDDDVKISDDFEIAPFLTRDVTDIESFKYPRPLPLLFDVIDNGASLAGEGDYIIYTNSDIHLMPHFYKVVRHFISLGFDAFSINRRTIDEHEYYHKMPELAAAEIGKNHKGYDCFIFPKKLLEKFTKPKVCLGQSRVDEALLDNMKRYAKNMVLFKNVDLTYHIGNDKPWKSAENADYRDYHDKVLLEMKLKWENEN